MASHEQELQDLEERLENDRHRQFLSLREKLNAKRNRKMDELRRKQDVESTKEMIEQKKEVDEIKLKKVSCWSIQLMMLVFSIEIMTDDKKIC